MVRKTEMEFLLTNFRLINAVLLNLWEELRNFDLSEDEVLDGLLLGNRILYSDEPLVQVTPSPGGRMTSIMQNYREIADARNNEVTREIANEILIIGEVIEKLTNSLDGLTENQRYIIQSIFFDAKAIKAIAAKLGIKAETARKERDNALEMLVAICRIRLSGYRVIEQKLRAKEG